MALIQKTDITTTRPMRRALLRINKGELEDFKQAYNLINTQKRGANLKKIYEYRYLMGNSDIGDRIDSFFLFVFRTKIIK